MGISVLEMQKRLKRVANETNLKNLVNTEIVEKEDVLVEIKKQEYEQGNIYSNGSRGYSNSSSYEQNLKAGFKKYKDFKRSLNPNAGGKVDLILSGDFINSFLLKEKGKGYEFDATDDKKNDLINYYGERIMGLSQEKFNAFLIKYVAPDFRKAIKKQLGQ